MKEAFLALVQTDRADETRQRDKAKISPDTAYRELLSVAVE